jgi:cytochrome b6-f complex iron-sulfur subunit
VTTGADKQGWFRCPCHGSTFTEAGIRVFGPAQRSMDTMDVVVGEGGRLTVDTGKITPGGPDNPNRAVRI